ncbi:hypothetical protein [Brachybacterium phenoliresistens]|uniref:hypothetical protein n=1 Tax=Brachybacterium phenoliresistens TaxID=396014 RepID=UPI0031D12A30
MTAHDLYAAVAGGLNVARERVRIVMGRLILGADDPRRTIREDQAFAALRAVGDDGTRLEQAVALAVADVPAAEVDALICRALEGPESKETPAPEHTGQICGVILGTLSPDTIEDELYGIRPEAGTYTLVVTGLSEYIAWGPGMTVTIHPKETP